MSCASYYRIFHVLNSFLGGPVAVSERVEFIERLKNLKFLGSSTAATIFITIEFAEIDLNRNIVKVECYLKETEPLICIVPEPSELPTLAPALW